MLEIDRFLSMNLSIIILHTWKNSEMKKSGTNKNNFIFSSLECITQYQTHLNYFYWRTVAYETLYLHSTGL